MARQEHPAKLTFFLSDPPTEVVLVEPFASAMSAKLCSVSINHWCATH